MKTIWKYDLEDAKDIQDITMPVDSQILTVKLQNGHPKMWVLVDPDKRPVRRVFALFGTGHGITTESVDNHLSYIDSYIILDDAIVFHLFEIL